MNYNYFYRILFALLILTAFCSCGNNSTPVVDHSTDSVVKTTSVEEDKSKEEIVTERVVSINGDSLKGKK